MSQTKGQKNPHHISSLWPRPLTVFGLDQKQTFRWIVLGRILPLSYSVLSGHLTRSRGTCTSSLSSSLGAHPRACGSLCASAWMRGWSSTPGRWCTGRAKHRCGYAGVWSWPSSPWSAGGRACTRTASHLHGEQKMSRCQEILYSEWCCWYSWTDRTTCLYGK